MMAMKADLLVLLLLFNFGEAMNLVNGQQEKWCVAKPLTTEIALKNDILYACDYVNCGDINPGGKCFDPDITIAHASFVMNLYYKSQGSSNPWNCDFTGSGLVTTANPSYGNCLYPVT